MKNMSNNETKLITKMLEEDNRLIQLVSLENDKSFTCVGNNKIESQLLVAAYLTEKNKVCMGQNALELGIHSPEENTEFRILIDRTKTDNRKFYVSLNNDHEFFKEKSDPECSGELLLLYIETQDVAQFTLFNNAIIDKVIDLSADSPRSVQNLRNVCHNFINLMVPRNQSGAEQ
ncbi:hypothetical protein [Bacillus sp. MUM 13]|uniref:hypothetical protein n=1 Tax=Bacillus sp. MUM 13 TaxID=1678001 RepID=UPI0008F58EE0|nr:hypothetical protein [Bacillus sp. MUM 13]OIK10239.1 hypothetical protein BIV59_14720 [Bacillus sp. MUM 13]